MANKRPREDESSKVVVEELCRSVKRLHTAGGEASAPQAEENERVDAWAGAPSLAHHPYPPLAQQQQQQQCGAEPLRQLNQHGAPWEAAQQLQAAAAATKQQHPAADAASLLQCSEIDWMSYDQANRMLGQLHMERMRRLGSGDGRS